MKPSTMRRKGEGIGAVHSFLCFDCGKTKSKLGSRIWRRVPICAECAQKRGMT